MQMNGRQPLAAAAATILALSAAGYAAAGGGSMLQSHGRPSVTPPPCAHDRDRNCGNDQGHDSGSNDKNKGDTGKGAKGDNKGVKGDYHAKSRK